MRTNAHRLHKICQWYEDNLLLFLPLLFFKYLEVMNMLTEKKCNEIPVNLYHSTKS